ncbi:MAG TPA: Flp pilus assembly protein CpaB [Acidobacteriaceae bacterium]|nr:Flp pilus assembly protein CpaB [Acidobacteriaceae bacterium]
MKAKRLMMALLAALLISGLSTFWLSRRLARAAHVEPSKKQRMVAANQTLEAGELLKPESLRLVDSPIALSGSFTKIEEVTGRVALFPLAKDQPILNSYLAPVGVGVGLTAKIPSGMRAISVRSDEVVGVAGFLLPGTHVDVLLTYHSDRSPDARTATVLQDVVVLAAGQQIRPDPEGKPTSDNNVVTLLLEPEDSEKLVLATSLGAIHFVLRNGADREQMPSSSVGLDELTGSTPALIPAEPAMAASPRRKPYQVETILGDKQVVSTFN